MKRYSRINSKNCREIVLLKAYPCAWGKCKFCDYTKDNSTNSQEIIETNKKVLSYVTGELGVLEIINSGSCFEIPGKTLILIRNIISQKEIKRLFLESHWIYRNKLQEMKNFMGIPITFKIGVETFNNEFRQKVLNKHADFKTPQEVKKYFDSPCIMVGIKGQSKEMIDHDIHLLKKYFKLGTINVYTNNSTDVKRDNELVKWFMEKYSYLKEDPAIEVLYSNTDFGVG